MSKVFINSLPKSGTNLLGKCFELLDFKLVDHIGSRAYLRNKFLRICGLTLGQGYIIGIDTPIEVSKSRIDNKLLRLQDGQFITAHVGYTSSILEKILENNILPILITRDPRAVLSSFVHYVVKEKKHVLHSHFISLSEQERFLAALKGFSANGVKLHSLRERCLSLDSWIRSEDVLKIKFEEIVGVKGGGNSDKQLKCLENIFEFTGSDLNKIKLVQENLFGPGTITFRKGRVDAWVEEVPDGLSPMIESDCGDLIKVWGYDGG